MHSILCDLKIWRPKSIMNKLENNKVMQSCLAVLMLLSVPSVHAAGGTSETINSYWSFDEGSKHTATGYVQFVKGVQGRALKFDGFTTRVTQSADTSISIANGFTVECWVAPQEYSWNWTGIVDQEKDHREGFSFGINHVGQVGLSLAIDGKWQTVLSADAIPLLKWSHVAATYDPSGGMAIYINGQPAAKKAKTPTMGRATPSKEDVWSGMSHTKQWPALTERNVSKTPTPMVFDGLIDEAKLVAKPLDPAAVMAAFKSVSPDNPQPLQFRKMPSGPKGPGPFGAYYTRLKYCDAWDRLWRVSDHPDIVVRFDESPTKIVFWRGTGYMPAWVSENDRWVCDQGPEIYKGQCFEHMSDKQCRFSHVRIIENTPARILVHWRTALPNAKYESTNTDPLTGWQPWGDDYYYIYPDGVCVRYQRAWGPGIHEFQQTEVLCQPGEKPQDVMEAEAITVMNLMGETNTFSWETAYGKRLPAEKKVDGPIQITNLKSRSRHFVIGESKARFKPFTFGALKGYSNFPNWNHWPVAQLPNDGRVAPAPDRPSSSCPGTLYPVRHKGEGIQEYVRNLYGMTDRDPRHLAVLARSWNNPPDLKLLSGAFSNGGYDKNQRAYQLTHTGNGKPETLHCKIQASVESPVANLAIVVKNWGSHQARLVINGQPVAEGKAFRVGHRRRLEGVDLIAWIKIESQKPVTISIDTE
jgi:hypothetical protein